MNSLAIVERFGGVLAPEMRFSMLPPSPGWPSHHRAGGERSWSLCACSGETGADCRRGDDGDYSASGDYGDSTLRQKGRGQDGRAILPQETDSKRASFR